MQGGTIVAEWRVSSRRLPGATVTLHVRVVSPPDLTELLADALTTASGVSNLVVLTGSARRPDGDAVHFDVLDRSANYVLRQVQALQGDHRNSIVIETVDAAIGEDPGPVPKRRLVQRDVAPVWDVVEAKIRSDAVYAPSFFILLTIAGLIGAVGILTNSQILIVGAMVVGPEYNAIMGVALGIDKRDRRAILQWPCVKLCCKPAACRNCYVMDRDRFGRVPNARPLGHTPRRRCPSRRILGSDHRNLALRPGDPLVRSHAQGILTGRAASLEPDRQAEPVLCRGRGPSRNRWRRLVDRSTGKRSHRRFHLGHNHSGRRRHRPVDGVRQLDRGLGLHTAVAAERRGAHHDRRAGPATPADHVASPHASRATRSSTTVVGERAVGRRQRMMSLRECQTGA